MDSPTARSQRSSAISLEFPGRTAELGRVRSVIRGFLAGSADEESVEQIVLAVDEACTNIIRHALAGDPKPVRLVCELAGNRLKIVLRDHGTPCDPACIKGRDMDEIRPGGLGVHIIQRVFDLVEYVPLADGTRLTLEKTL